MKKIAVPPRYPLERELEHSKDKFNPMAAILGRRLSSLISMAYIFGFRNENAIFFNDLVQNRPICVPPKRLCH